MRRAAAEVWGVRVIRRTLRDRGRRVIRHRGSPGLHRAGALNNPWAIVPRRDAMPRFYRPPLDGREEDPFARDGDDKLIRRAYWLGLSDRSLVQLMTKGIGTRLSADEKRDHLEDIRRAHLIEQVLAPEILPPERR
jgi:hypothetical protein